MLFYPQLTTGAISQFPIRCTVRIRTITNQLPSGCVIPMPDPGWRKVQWQLRYSNLTDAERGALETLFEAAEGQLNTFTFLDPTANLLSWSEDWTQAVWTADPLLQIRTGVADPLGGACAVQLTNTAQTAQQILQQTMAPSACLYCFSVYLRSDVTAAVKLVALSGAQAQQLSTVAGPVWSRAVFPVNFSAQGEGVAFGIQLESGVQVQAFGAQVEGQPGAGAYKKTTDLSGIYGSTRFASDLFLSTATAPNQNACEVELVSSLN